jgi:cell division septation protein DedD
MLSRILFLLLLAMNIGVALWLYFAPQPRAHAFTPADPGVPKLVLLSEREHANDASAAELASAPEAAAQPRNGICASIGPFPTQADMRTALNALTPLVARIQYREASATETRGYWVYLAAQSSRERALGLARQLSEKGVRDYYVVTAGDQPNTISLGLFHDQANADKRRDEVAKLGFAPEVVARTEELPVYWIDFAEERDHPLDWRALMVAQLELRQQAVTCF